MLFDGLARFIAKHHRVVAVVWVAALVGCVPLFSLAAGVTANQAGLGSPTGESATVQSILDSKFSASGSGATLFLVITTQNATSPSVRGFVESFANATRGDPALFNLTSVGTVYKSVANVVDGAVGAERPLRAGAATLTQLFYGVPAAFLGTWNATYALNPTYISQAAAMTSALLSRSIANQTVLSEAQQYLQGFTQALSASYSVSPSLPLGQRMLGAINATGTAAVNTVIPAAQRSFASAVLRSFTLQNYSNPASLEDFVTYQTAKVSLYSQTFARAVYHLSEGPVSGNESALISSMVANPSAYDIPAVYLNAVTGYVSPDRRIQLIVLDFKGVTDGEVNALRSLVSSEAPKYGLGGQVGLTGGPVLSYDFRQSSFGDLTLILPITIIILIVATGLFFRSVVTPGVSLFSIGIALGIADSAIIYLVGKYVVGVDSNVPNILLSVVIGVGTDYSVFLLARYREERARGKGKLEAVSKSVAWAGESIATSGLTVIISFVLLGTLQSVSLLRSLGLVVGAGVLVALAGSLTLVPSLVLIVPDAVFWPNVGRRFANYARSVERSIENKTGYFSRSAKFSIKHAKLIVFLSLVATGPALYVWGTAPVGYDFLAAAPTNLESVTAFNAMSQSFGAGKLYPTYAVMQFSQPLWNGSSYDAAEMKAVDSLTNVTLAAGNVLSVTGPTRPAGERVDVYQLGNDSRSRALERSINGMISNDGHYALLNIDFVASPQSETSIGTAQQLREEYRAFMSSDAQFLQGVYLGGAAGSTLDTKNSVNSQFDIVIAYVMVGVAAVLLVVLGSLFLPAFAIVSILMSIAWTLAATDLVFQYFYNFPILFITPLTLFVLLLGLGMDYNIFILTRIREEASKGAPLNEAITTAIERTGGIITAAALILAGSLGSLMISSNLLLKEFGFAFFYSILIDAMIMRTYVVPSVMSLMGKWNWYAPGRLQRVRISDASKGNR
ncbi:MAG: MMPL family transporter [Nitrososphaerales archaeon]|nr:MMPL family transporter [Nitrososphaerales archaeon]